MMTVNTTSVISAFEIDVTIRIQAGQRAFVSRNPRACSDIRPALVLSAKKSQRNRPMMRLSL